ncbi:hypothetical protein HC928_02525 [bacterium]|nr:hypothetical protein [bacterium]
MKDPNLEKWASTLRLINQQDKRSWEEIKEMIDWALDHEFWCRNILSPSKLREKFDILLAQMTPAQNKGSQIKKNKDLCWEIKNHFKDSDVYKNINIYENFVLIVDKKEKILFDMNPLVFEDVLSKLLNISRKS